MKKFEKIILLLSFLSVALLVVFPVSNPDIFWHMANGKFMVEERGIADEELFSYTVPGRKFINNNWLAQIIFYLVFHLTGTTGLVFFKAGIILLTAFFLYKTARLNKTDALTVSILIVVIILAGLSRYTVRPQIFSYLFLSILSFLLFGYRTGKIKYRYLFLIPIIMTIWDFMHGAVYGLLFLSAFISGEQIKKTVPRNEPVRTPAASYDAAGLRPLWFILAVTLLFMFINPYGIRTYGSFLQLTYGQDLIVSANTEFQPTQLTSFPVFWAMLFLLGLLSIVYIRRVDITHLFVLIPFAVMAIRFQRATAAFALISMPALSYYLMIAGSKINSSLQQIIWKFGRIALFLSALILIVYIKFLSPGHVYYFGYDINENYQPVGATRFIQHSNISGNMYNSGQFGGYLAFNAFPENRIFQYYHMDLFGDIQQQVHNKEFLNTYNVNYAIIPAGVELMLLFTPDTWTPVYWDNSAVVVVKKTPENAAFIKKYGLDYYRPGITRSELNELASPPSVLPELIREISDCLSFIQNIDLADHLGNLLKSPEAGLNPADRLSLIKNALPYNSGSAGLWDALGTFYYIDGDIENAGPAFKKALKINKTMIDPRINLAYIELDKGNFMKAVSMFDDITLDNTNSANAYFGLGLAHMNLGKSDLAQEDFNRFLRLTPSGPWADKARAHLKAMAKARNRQ